MNGTSPGWTRHVHNTAAEHVPHRGSLSELFLKNRLQLNFASMLGDNYLGELATDLQRYS
jgi:hypothetical protein